MRAPGQGRSFRDVITDFLQQQECSESQKQFLQRIRDDDASRVDEVWSRFVEKQPKLTDGDRTVFIKCLALGWGIVELARYEAVDKRLRQLAGTLEGRLKKYWAKRFIEASADELPKILKEMEWFSRECESSPIPLSEFPLSEFFPELDIRSDHEGSRPRTGFMRFISKFAREVTGDWCDDEVATLTDVAFPRDESTTIDMVRSARRPMRTAR
jgi:hypothetical protein